MMLETVSGFKINPVDPDPELITIKDIAWSLSRIARFAGHTITAIPYSVAQHSCFVASLIEQDGYNKNVVMFGLLHDAAESLIGDIPSPIKKIPELKSVIDPIEQRLLDVIYQKFMARLPTNDEWEIVKFYDKKAQFIEAYNFMYSRGRDWVGRENYDIDLVDLQEFPEPIVSTAAYELFLKQFGEQ